MTDLYSALVAIVWGLHGPESVPYTIRNHWRKALLYQHRFDVNIREIYIYLLFSGAGTRKCQLHLSVKRGLLSCWEERFPELNSWCFCNWHLVESSIGKSPLSDNTPLSELYMHLETPEVKGLVSLTPLLKIFMRLTVSWFQFLWQS